jgi:hypothetical protein
VQVFATRYDCTVMIRVGQGSSFVFMKILFAYIHLVNCVNFISLLSKPQELDPLFPAYLTIII